MSPQFWPPVVVSAATPTAGPSFTLTNVVLRRDPFGWVDMQFTATRTSGAITTGDVLATIPAGFRPPVNWPFAGLLTNLDGTVAAVRVRADGVADVFLSAAGRTTLFVSGRYPAA